MKPSDWLMQLSGHYPSLRELDPEFRMTPDDSLRFVSVWLCEGIPFAFQSHPAAFGAVCEWLSGRMHISFRDIGLTGSARLGYSLNPRKFGAQYTEETSDIDLFVVNQRWFENLSQEACAFVEDLRSGSVAPSNEAQRRYWPDNASTVVSNIKNGFIDSWKVPTLDRYEAFCDIGQAAYGFHLNLEKWIGRKFIKRTKIRVYTDWEHARKQMSYNLRKAIEHRGC